MASCSTTKLTFAAGETRAGRSSPGTNTTHCTYSAVERVNFISLPKKKKHEKKQGETNKQVSDIP